MWHLEGTPYEVQEKALKYARGKKGYGWFLEMGLGKTAIAIAEFVDLLMEDKVDYMVVVCPNSLKRVWSDEVRQWTANSLSTVLWPATGLSDANRVFVLNYEAIRGTGGDYLEKLLQRHRIYLVFDESVKIKTPRAQVSKRSRQLAREAIVVRLLSGQPIVNSPLDIWSQLRAIGGTTYENPFAFRNHFCIMGGFKMHQVVGAKNEDELHDIIDACSFQAKKKDWTDLPPQLYTERHYTLNPVLQKAYDQMLKEYVLLLNEEESVSVDMVITQIMKLQQIASGFIIDEERKIRHLIDVDESNKIKLLQEICWETPGKIIIFCFYRASTVIIANALETDLIIKGGMPVDDIEEVKADFNSNSENNYLVVQASTGKYGHTLLGDQETAPCNTAIFYENDYNLDTRIQAEARNHRYGQRLPVTYIDLVGTPLCSKIIGALQRKEKLAESIMQYIKG